MLSLIFKCFTWNWIPFWFFHVGVPPFWSLVHPFPRYYLLTTHTQRFTSQRFASQRFPVATSTQLNTMTSYYFSSLFTTCWSLKKDNHKGIHTCLCLVYTLTSICLAQWNICSQCKNVLEQIAQDLSLVLRAPKHKSYTFYVSCRFFMILLFQSPDSTFFRVAQLRQNGRIGDPKQPCFMCFVPYFLQPISMK